MENHQQQIQQVIGVLKQSYNAIDTIITDPQISHLKSKLLNQLSREISSISLQNGFDYDVKQMDTVIGAPLKKIMGREINVKGDSPEKQLVADKPIQSQVIQKSAQEVEASEFKEKTLELYGKFSTIDNEAILDQFEDMVIRGIGKLAGLPVTENHPKKVDVKFINEIKEAIKKKDELENASATAALGLGLSDDDLNGQLGDDDIQSQVIQKSAQEVEVKHAATHEHEQKSSQDINAGANDAPSKSVVKGPNTEVPKVSTSKISDQKKPDEKK